MSHSRSRKRRRLERDPCLDWMEQHPEELAKHAPGTRVAIHPTRGIVAAGPDYLTVHAEIVLLGLMEDVLVAVVQDPNVVPLPVSLLFPPGQPTED